MERQRGGIVTTDIGLYNGADTNMSELICIIGRISTSIGDKQQSRVADLGKYVHLPEVGTFQVSISVTKS